MEEANDDGDEQSSREEYFYKRIESMLKSQGLSMFRAKVALEYIKKSMQTPDEFRHLVPHILNQLNNRLPGREPTIRSSGDDSTVEQRNWQYGCPEIIPGLTARPFWNTSGFEWIGLLESKFHEIRSELLSNQKVCNRLFQPYRSPHAQKDFCQLDPVTGGYSATDTGNWNVCYLYLHGIDFKENIEHFPVTMSVIEQIPRHYQHCFFSALSSGSHVVAHTGPTNKKLRCQLPLVVPQGQCWLRAGEEKVVLEEGKCILFDDSFEHEAANDSPEGARIILIVDVWHPDLSDIEVRYLEFINKSQMAAAKQIRKEMLETPSPEGSSEDDFLTVIIETRRANLSIPDEQLWGSRVVDD